jgi:hypothetical protein
MEYVWNPRRQRAGSCDNRRVCVLKALALLRPDLRDEAVRIDMARDCPGRRGERMMWATVPIRGGEAVSRLPCGVAFAAQNTSRSRRST